MKRRPLLTLILTLALVLGSVAGALADFSEYELKAGFLLRFAELTDWPAAVTSISIGVLGDDPFGDSLERTVAGQKVSGRPVTIRRGRRVEDLRGCQIIFVSKSERGRAGEIAGALANSGVLSVGDFDQFAQQGGVIGFVLDKDKIRFDVNPAAARQSGVKVSTRLLKAGHIIGS